MTIARNPRRLAGQQTVVASDLNHAIGAVADAMGGPYWDTSGNTHAGTGLDSTNFRERGWITNDVKACPYTVFPLRLYIAELTPAAGTKSYYLSLPPAEGPLMAPATFAVTAGFVGWDVATTGNFGGTLKIYRVDRDSNAQIGGNITFSRAALAALPLIDASLDGVANSQLSVGQRVLLEFSGLSFAAGPPAATTLTGLAVDLWLKAKHVTG